MFPKPKTYRSEKYKAWVREQSCTLHFCGKPHTFHDLKSYPIEAAHTEHAGMGIRGSDLSCIPLCSYHHAKQHHLGVKTFEEKYAVDLEREATKTLRRYVEEQLG